MDATADSGARATEKCGDIVGPPAAVYPVLSGGMVNRRLQNAGSSPGRLGSSRAAARTLPATRDAMYSSSQFHSIGVAVFLVIAAILCYAGLQFAIGRPPHLSMRSTNDPTHFYDDIAAELADSSHPLR